MDMTNKEYGSYVNGKSKPSPCLKNCVWAFCVGGLICTLGQLLLNFYQNNCALEKDGGGVGDTHSALRDPHRPGRF